MTLMADAVRNTIEAISPAVEKAGDWRGEDGLLVCGVCGEAKETTFAYGGRTEVVPCLCRCAREEEQRKQAKWEATQKKIRIERLRDAGIRDNSLKSCRFESADMTPQMERCKLYADNFDDFKDANIGMIFCGPVGNGKTYAAACIANELIDRGIPVLITSLPRILNASKNDLNEIIREVQKYDLVIVDDFGTERQTEFAMETAQYFLDERYKSGKPTIITTNLGKKDIETPANPQYARMFSRIKEMCQVMVFPKNDRRSDKAELKKQAAKELILKLQVSGDGNA